MSELTNYRPGGPPIARKADGNPEGKGMNGLMLDWYRSEPKGVVAKPQPQVLAEFFTSMLILSAAFKYRPVPGGLNYLYWIDGDWRLSLIAPEEWDEGWRMGFAGTCVLQPDMTWTIEPSERLAGGNPVSDAVGRFYRAFAEMLHTDLPLEQLLPTYVTGVGYQQRLYANAMGRSIHASVVLGDDSEIRASDWRRWLPRLDQALLPFRDGATDAPAR